MGVYRNNNNNLELIAGGPVTQYAPIGAITPFGGTLIPNGWLLCDGSAVSRTEYKVLFDVIGTAFGTGDGSTTFNLPDLRGEFLRGAGTNSRTEQGNGGALGEHQDATLHRNDGGVASNYARFTSYPGVWQAINSDKTQSRTITEYGASVSVISGSTSDVVTYTSRPTNTSVNFIIKAKIVSKETDAEIEGEKYSTDEKWTGKYWIDGKPIYRKVVIANNQYTGDRASAWVNTNLDYPANVDKVTHQEVLMATGKESGNNILVDVITSTNKIRFGLLNSYWVGRVISHFIFEYTKTTD